MATDPKEAGALMGQKDEKWGDAVEEAGLEWLKSNGGGAKVATLGWCMGGGESLKASLNDPKDVNGTIIYYGMPVTDPSKLKALRGPVLGIWANQDGWITPDKVKAFDDKGNEVQVSLTDPDPVLYIFKTSAEAQSGDLSYFRLYSGSIHMGQDVYNSDR